MRIRTILFKVCLVIMNSKMISDVLQANMVNILKRGIFSMVNIVYNVKLFPEVTSAYILNCSILLYFTETHKLSYYKNKKVL